MKSLFNTDLAFMTGALLMIVRPMFPLACTVAVGLFSATATSSAAQDTGTVGADQLGFSVRNMDPSVDPAEDFYRYAAGGWLVRIDRPEKHPKYSIFTITGEIVQAQV
ncbi:hypothetical protein, partial [Salipiger sp. PrR003]|uniref:hypothetical protein n=1 Tax=Salipiger sp. PrR003 TaxID=2706776 RepID=UPI00194553D7